MYSRYLHIKSVVAAIVAITPLTAKAQQPEVKLQLHIVRIVNGQEQPWSNAVVMIFPSDDNPLAVRANVEGNVAFMFNSCQHVVLWVGNDRTSPKARIGPLSGRISQNLSHVEDPRIVISSRICSARCMEYAGPIEPIDAASQRRMDSLSDKEIAMSDLLQDLYELHGGRLMNRDYKDFVKEMRNPILAATTPANVAGAVERESFRATRERLLQRIDSLLQKPWRLGITHDVGDRIGDVLISDVRPGTPAQRAGLQPGEEIVALNGIPLRDYHESFAHAVANSESQNVELTVKSRSSNLRIIQVQLQR